MKVINKTKVTFNKRNKVRMSALLNNAYFRDIFFKYPSPLQIIPDLWKILANWVKRTKSISLFDVTAEAANRFYSANAIRCCHIF